jgi:uncharacterized protein (TIGR03083 family)
MALERHWLTDQARRERDAMGRSVQYTEAEYWERDSVLPGWLNRDLIAHLAGMDGAAASLVGGEPAVEIDAYRQGLDGAAFTVDGFNAVLVGRRRADSVVGVAAEWGRGADLLLARCSELSDEDWTTRRVDWVGGELRVPYLLQSRLVEWWLHGEDLRAGADLAPRREHPPIFCANDLAVRMIPYGLGLAGLSFPGKSIRVELEGAGGGSWHYGLAARESPQGGGRPDAVIEGRGYPFAMVAGGRVSADEYLTTGGLLLGGDLALGRTVLDHLRLAAA